MAIFDYPDDALNGHIPTQYVDIDAGVGNTVDEIVVAIQPGDNYIGQERLVADGDNTFRLQAGESKTYSVSGLLSRFLLVGLGTVDNLAGNVVNESSRNLTNMLVAARAFTFRTTHGVTGVQLTLRSYGQTARVFMKRDTIDPITDYTPSSPYGWNPMFEDTLSDSTKIESQGTTPDWQVNDISTQLATADDVYSGGYVVPDGNHYARDTTSQAFYRMDTMTKDFIVSCQIDLPTSLTNTAVIFDTGSESASADVLAGGGYALQLRSDDLLQFRIRPQGGAVVTVFSYDISSMIAPFPSTLIGTSFTFQFVIRFHTDGLIYYDAYINGMILKSDIINITKALLPSLTAGAGIVLFATARTPPNGLLKPLNSAGEGCGIRSLEFLRLDNNQRHTYSAMAAEKFGTQNTLPRAGANL
jgi:hypothetical protein